jgi:AbiU2
VSRHSKPKMFEYLAAAKRIREAKAKTDRVVDHLNYLLKLHENNAIIAYSDALSSQITVAHAADAFKAFRSGLYHIETVHLCALWDPAKEDKKKKKISTEESIPTIIELIALPEVIEAIEKKVKGRWPSDDDRFAHKQAKKARKELEKAIKDVRTILKSPMLKRTKNVRHKHLAHSLSKTKPGIARMKYGDERKLLFKSLPIVEVLHRWINNGADFRFARTQEAARNHAEALWKGCTFDIKR